MHIRATIAVFALASSLSGAALSQSAAPAAPAASQGGPDPDRVICKVERPTGSQIPSKVCKTAAVWELERELSRKMIQDAQQRTGSTSSR